MDWENYFSKLADWKKLPAYRAEPRIDSLVGSYLKPMVGDFIGQQITHVIPELPIRLATVKPKHEGTNYSDRSYKVDFYAIDIKGMNYLIEFKTDSKSRRSKQDEYLDEAKNIGMKAIVGGIYKISQVSSYKGKYKHLLEKLRGCDLLDENNNYTGKNDKIEIIYIQPSIKSRNEKCIDFNWISNWLKSKYPNEKFEVEFANALKKWADD